MKKYFALILSAAAVLTCFTSCGTKVKGGEVVTDNAQNPVVVITEKDGALKRDENGNAVVMVTDANGKNVKDKDGNYATQAFTVKHVLRIGDLAETKHFTIGIPDGWEYDDTSFNTLRFINDKGDRINIDSTDGKTASQLLADDLIIKAVDNSFPDSVKVNSSVKIDGKEFPFVARFVTKDSNGGQSYLGMIFFDHGNHGFTCMITGNRDVTEDIGDIEEVLNTIQFK